MRRPVREPWLIQVVLHWTDGSTVSILFCAYKSEIAVASNLALRLLLLRSESLVLVGESSRVTDQPAELDTQTWPLNDVIWISTNARRESNTELVAHHQYSEPTDGIWVSNTFKGEHCAQTLRLVYGETDLVKVVGRWSDAQHAYLQDQLEQHVHK